MTDQMKNELKPILRDLVLWNNKHNNKEYLSLCIQEDDWRGISVDVNNEHWNHMDDRDRRIDTWFTEDELINM